MIENGSRRSLEIHGSPLELLCTLPDLQASIDVLLDHSASTNAWPNDSAPIGGEVHPFESDHVLANLPSDARHIGQTLESADLYQDQDHFWLVDDRWGMTQLHLSARRWRSWILPRPALDWLRVAERSVLWPLAQLMQPRDLHLMPAVSAVKDGFAVLMICPMGLEPELMAMISAGFRVIGQRWTALREEDGRLALLHMPGRCERLAAPRLRSAALEQQTWIDLRREYPASHQNHAFCDAVLVIERGRGAQSQFRERSGLSGAEVLRDHWPIDLLQAGNEGSDICDRVNLHSRCYEVELSRSPKDFLAMLHSMRYAPTHVDQRSAA